MKKFFQNYIKVFELDEQTVMTLALANFNKTF